MNINMRSFLNMRHFLSFLFESAKHLMVCDKSKARQLFSSVLQSVRKDVGKRHVCLQVSCWKVWKSTFCEARQTGVDKHWPFPELTSASESPLLREVPQISRHTRKAGLDPWQHNKQAHKESWNADFSLFLAAGLEGQLRKVVENISGIRFSESDIRIFGFMRSKPKNPSLPENQPRIILLSLTRTTY